MIRAAMESSSERQAEVVSRRLVVWISLVLLVGMAGFGLYVVRAFQLSLAPELDRRAALIGTAIRDDLTRALSFGIPLERMAGVEAYFRSHLEAFPELEYLAIRDLDGSTVFFRGAEAGRQGDTSASSVVHAFPVALAAGPVGTVEVGVDRAFARSRLRDIALDVMVILLVAVVAVFEMTLAISQRIVARRAAQHAQDDAATKGSVGDIRLVLFLFALGEELNKSFLPMYIGAARNPFPWLGANVAISLPIVAYVLTLAIITPLAGRMGARIGQRGLFLIGIVPAALSHVGMAFAQDLIVIVGLRALTGVGYGLATVACQEYLLDRLEVGRRARSAGVFVAVVIGGTFAGTALGGIFADKLGYQAVFWISAMIVAASGTLALGMMQGGRESSGRDAATFALRDVLSVLKRPALLSLLAGVTVPMNVLMAAFLWYLVPLTMAGVGANASAIARTLMLYYLIILLVGPAAGAAADRAMGRRRLVGLASLVSAAALFLPVAAPMAATITAAVLIVGIGHAAVRGPQIALALDLAEEDGAPKGRGAVLAAMRSLERFGSLVGLLGISLVASRYGYIAAMGVVGVLTAMAAVAFLVTSPTEVRVESRQA
jgi:predicted MFS family arabinose efflux permease